MMVNVDHVITIMMLNDVKLQNVDDSFGGWWSIMANDDGAYVNHD